MLLQQKNNPSESLKRFQDAWRCKDRRLKHFQDALKITGCFAALVRPQGSIVPDVRDAAFR